MERNIIIKQTNGLREFARDVLHLLYEVDKFSRLREDNILVNYGSPVEDIDESSIGFLLEPIIDLEGLFYWCDEVDWNEKVRMSEEADIFFMNERFYLFSYNQWSEEAECYPDGTLKYPIIKDLALLIVVYYPQFSIERLSNKYVLVQ